MKASKVHIGIPATEATEQGFERLDRAEAGRLSVDEASLDSLRVTGTLEYVPSADVPNLLRHWYDKLAPGGRIEIAVPDAAWIAKNYLAGQPIPTEDLLLGGESPKRSMYDEETLIELLADARFERIGAWVKRDGFVAVRAFKPMSSEVRCVNTVGVLSAPRYGPMLHARCALAAFGSAGVQYQVQMGAFWHQCLSEGIETMLGHGFEFIITADYDTIFSKQDVVELYRLMKAYENADCIIPVQMKRHEPSPLVGILDAQGKPRDRVGAHEFNRNLTRVHSGHFGLTIFRASAFKKLPRPWMTPKPAADGRWNEGDDNKGIHGKTDADIDFWQNWHKAGLTLFLANRVVVGHHVEVVMWPGKDLQPVYQTVQDYIEQGIPAEVVR